MASSKPSDKSENCRYDLSLDQLLLNSAPDALLLIDQFGVIQHSNCASEKLLGKSRGEIIGDSLGTYLIDATRLLQLFLAEVSNPNANTVSASYQTTRLASNKIVPIELTLTLVENSFKPLICVKVHDCQDRITAGPGLAALQGNPTELICAIFDSVPGLLYLYNADGKLICWNKRHEDETGYSAAELAGMKATDWFEGGDLDGMREAWQKVFEEGYAQRDLNLIVKGEKKIPYRLTGVRVEFGGQPHLVGIGIDMTQQKYLESEVNRQRLEWEHISRVALAGELAAALAHELNQPLTAIMNNAQAARRLMVKGMLNNAELEEILVDIIADDRRAGGVIRSVREFLKKEQSQLAPVAINELIRNTCRLIEADALIHHVAIRFDLAEDLPSVQGDRIQLQQVLLNLMINALSAMRSPTCSTRSLELRTRAQAGGEVEVSVSDSGHGIALDQLENIFDSFVSTKKEGLGMGLAIARSIVERHGGRIWVENARRGGAIFSFTVPVSAD